MSGEKLNPRVEVLTELRKQTALLERIAVELLRGNQSDERAEPTSERIPAAVLDGPHGDPLVRAKDPKDWCGDPMKGRKFSECSPEYLDLLAVRFDYFAGREMDPTKKRYNELDAIRARGWAARKRSGWTPPVSAPTVSEAGREPTW